MAKDNAQIQRDKRAKENALLELIGAEKRTVIVSKALDDALQILGERHDFEEWQGISIALAKITDVQNRHQNLCRQMTDAMLSQHIFGI